MKNIILQQYDRTPGLLETLSIKNIQNYASLIGADYHLVTGKPFREYLTPPCQKLFMLDESFDAWDNILMLDIDMFTPKGMVENIFDIVGVGLHAAPVQPMLHRKIVLDNPDIASMDSPYWGGAIYKLSRELRIALREHLGGNEMWMSRFNHPSACQDEGIMHVLATRAKIPLDNAYLEQKWCQCSYLPHPERAGFIHIRTKVTPTGPKREKIENYNDFVERGIITQ